MKEEEYMRVGTTVYKVVNQPCANGGYEKKRVVWNNSTLRQDYGKNYLATVPKYDGFCTVPNHLNYQKEIEGFLNLYEPIEHKPQQGDLAHIQIGIEDRLFVPDRLSHITAPWVNDTAAADTDLIGQHIDFMGGSQVFGVHGLGEILVRIDDETAPLHGDMPDGFQPLGIVIGVGGQIDGNALFI